MSTYELDDEMVRAVVDGNKNGTPIPLPGLCLELEKQIPVNRDEPKKFGAVVRAGVDGLSDRVLWQRGPKGGWTSEEGAYSASYDRLYMPEVEWEGTE